MRLRTSDRAQHRRVVAALLAAATTCLTAGCSSWPGLDSDPQDSPKVMVPGADQGSELYKGIPRVPRDAPWVIEGVTVCLDKPGSVALTKVEATGADVVVTDFALRDNPAWKGRSTHGLPLRQDFGGDLAEARFDTSVKTVTHTCDDKTGQGHEIGIELRSPKTGIARITGFDVHYDRSGASTVARIPFEVTLCPHKVSWHPECARTQE